MRELRMQIPRLALIGLFIGMLITWCLTAAPVVADSGMAHGKGRLFEVSQPGAPPSYVFGTMHVSDEAVLKLAPPIARAFKGSRVLLLEVAESAHSRVESLQVKSLDDGRSLRDVIGPRLHAEVVDAAMDYGVSGAMLDRFQPWALIGLFSLPKPETTRQASGDLVLDRALEAYARKRGIAVASLETPAESLAVFSALSDAEQIELLESVLDNRDKVDSAISAMVKTYSAGDLETLYGAFASAGPDASAEAERAVDLFAHQFIAVRNQHWIPRLGPYLKAGGAFVAVGALHLPGEDGVLRLLEKAGYRVTRVL